MLHNSVLLQQCVVFWLLEARLLNPEVQSVRLLIEHPINELKFLLIE